MTTMGELEYQLRIAAALERIADALENKSAATWPEVVVENLRIGDRIYRPEHNKISTVAAIAVLGREPRTGNVQLSVEYDDGTSIGTSTLYGGRFQREPAKP